MKRKPRRAGDSTVVAVEGRIDAVSAPNFQERMDLCISEGATRLIVDCTNLNHISSAGLRALMVAATAVKSKGRELSCCALSGLVRKVFEVGGFTALLPVYETVEEAVNKD